MLLNHIAGLLCRLIIALIETQEDLFQRRLVRHNIRRAPFARDLDDLCQRPLNVELHAAPVDSSFRFDDARDMLKPLRGGRPGKADLHIVLVDILERGDVIDLDQPPFANDRHAVAGVFDFGQDVRGEKDSTSLCAHLGHNFIEFLLVERIQPAGWLVEDEDARLVHEGLNQPDLAFVAARILTKLACGVEIKPLNELLEVCLVDAAAQVAQVFENLTAAQARIKGELAGQIADQLLDFGRLRPAIQAANGGAAAVGAQQTHQRAHSGGFACAVESQEAENLALQNVEGYVNDAPVPAIAFCEPVGLNNSSHIFSLLPV